MTDTREKVLRVHFASAPDEVYRFLATDSGRAAFWADYAVETEGVIEFHFSNGVRLTSRQRRL